MTLLVMQVSIVVPNKYQRRNHCSRFSIDRCPRWNVDRRRVKVIGRWKFCVVGLQVVSENRSTELVSGSTVVEQNQATQSCCCRSIKSVFSYGSCVPDLQDLVRISVVVPCRFWYGWACT
ncbi:hypothetical protein F2Q70_00003797 [Brassica cretica]|uniref:Uncharacterized protein n=1 Tax=Brassica cretica TaxID=69181 RepID=A0A8S9J4S9_BRACR|nr:hypothetical protein F2Q70_00003797 [Brassica cretica]